MNQEEMDAELEELKEELKTSSREEIIQARDFFQKAINIINSNLNMNI